MTISKRLLNFIKEREGQWVKKIDLFVFAYEYGYSPESVGRALRDLSETKDGGAPKIKKTYYNGRLAKGLVQYSYNPQPFKSPIRIVDGVAYFQQPLPILNTNHVYNDK